MAMWINVCDLPVTPMAEASPTHSSMEDRWLWSSSDHKGASLRCTQSVSYWMSFSLYPTFALVVTDGTHTHWWHWAFLYNKADKPSEPGMEMCPNATSATTLGRCLSGRGSGVARDGGSGHWQLCAPVWQICALACKKNQYCFSLVLSPQVSWWIITFPPMSPPPILLSVCFSCFRVEHRITSQGDDTKRGSSTLSPSDHVPGDWMLASAIKQGRISQDLPANLWGLLLQAPWSQKGTCPWLGFSAKGDCAHCSITYVWEDVPPLYQAAFQKVIYFSWEEGRRMGDGVWKAMKLQLISQRRSLLIWQGDHIS